MKNNILKEIKDEIINKGKESQTDNLERFISEEKLFSILFYTNRFPSSNKILPIIKKYISPNENIKLIIIICEDDEIEYNNILNSLNDISCLTMKYNSKNNETLINNYNIIALPRLLILDNNGKKIDTLNSEQILNLNENVILGWINKFEIPKIYKMRKPEVGDRANVSNHPHEVIFSDYSIKASRYRKGGWICDVCRKNFNYDVPNFCCLLCTFDICDSCFPKYHC